MSHTSGNGAQAPARSAGEILADIQRERSGLSTSFEVLRGDLDEAADAARKRARDVGRKTAVIAPMVAAVIVAAAGASLLRRRR